MKLGIVDYDVWCRFYESCYGQDFWVQNVLASSIPQPTKLVFDIIFSDITKTVCDSTSVRGKVHAINFINAF